MLNGGRVPKAHADWNRTTDKVQANLVSMISEADANFKALGVPWMTTQRCVVEREISTNKDAFYEVLGTHPSSSPPLPPPGTPLL